MKRFSFLLAIFSLLLASAVEARSFSDVPRSSPYFEAISALSDAGTLSGYANGTFKPNATVNRVEALKILLLGSGVVVPETTDEPGFTDAHGGEWYSKFLVQGKRLGIVKGNADGSFAPTRTVNYAEAIKMILKTNAVAIPDSVSQNPFADIPKGEWYAPYFLAARELHLIDKESTAKVFPGKLVSRGEMAFLLYKLQQLVETKGREVGVASYYHTSLEGKPTSSGEFFSNNKFTAAHRTLPFGTKLRVTALENGKSVVVSVNDRGPYLPERVIDLSSTAFESLAPLSRGVIAVSIVPVTDQPVGEAISTPATLPKVTNCSLPSGRPVIKKDAFSKIPLRAELPALFQKEEVYRVDGRVSSSSATKVTVFMEPKNGGEKSVFTGFVQAGEFSLPVTFQSTGKFDLAIIEGTSGEATAQTIEVVDPSCQKALPDTAATALNLRTEIIGNDLFFRWETAHPLSLLTITQGKQVVYHLISSGQTSWKADSSEFRNFSSGEAIWNVQTAQSSSSFSLDRSSVWSKAASAPLLLTKHQFSEVRDEITTSNLPSTFGLGTAIEFTAVLKSDARATALVILPDGQVQEVPLSSKTPKQANTSGYDIFPKGSTITFHYEPKTLGTHIVEVNDVGGIALINAPVYPKTTTPILPDFVDLNERTPFSGTVNLANDRTSWLALLNRDREENGVLAVPLDDSLNALAQSRADDMAKRGYFSHITLEGKDANKLKFDFGITTAVSENIASDVGIPFAEYGLMRSAGHRANIIEKNWTRCGLGITKKSDGTLVFVQIFSTDPIKVSDIPRLSDALLATINSHRSMPLTPNAALSSIAQNWSADMATKDFFDFTSPSGTALSTVVRNAGIKVTIGTSILGNSDFDGVQKSAVENIALFDARWKNIGVGIAQDNAGIIKVTLLYSE